MTTTLAWLQANDHAHLALTLAIDGHRTIYTTTAASDAMLTAYAGTDYTACKPSLDVVGETSQSIGLFDPRVEAETLSFRLLEDDAATLLETLLRPWSTDDKKTYLTADLDCNDTSISCAAVTSFSGVDTIWIGHECITVGGTTESTDRTIAFTSCTRGVAALGTTSTGAAFGRLHLIDRTLSADYQSAPTVTNAPRAWHNREVALRLHHGVEQGVIDDEAPAWYDTRYTSWSTLANARTVWLGRIKSWRDDGDGWVTIECRDIRERLDASAFPQQWSAEIPQGAYLPSAQASIHVGANYGGTFTGAISTLSTSEAVYTWREVFAAVASAFDAATDANVRFTASVAATADGERVQFIATRQSGNFVENDPFVVRLNPLVLLLLGFIENPGDAGTFSYDASTRLSTMIELPMTAASTRTMTAGWAPVTYPNSVRVGSSFTFTNATGTYTAQPAGTVPPAAGTLSTGIVRIDDSFYGVSVSGSVLSIHSKFTDPQAVTSAPSDPNAVMREGEGGEIPRVRQVWYDSGPAGTTLLRLLLSTGTSGFNHPLYDVYGVGVGLGIPYSYVNATSIRALNNVAPRYVLVIDEPIKFADILEGILAFTNRYLVLDDGELRLIAPATESAVDADLYRLTEDNKATPTDRTKVSYATGGIITQASAKCARDWISGRYDLEETIIFDAARSALGDGSGSKVKMDGRGFTDLGPWFDSVIPMLPYFQRPPAICTRTIDASLIDLVPGAKVTVDDDHLASPTAGTRGVSGLLGWVLSSSFDWRSGVGSVTFVAGGGGDVWAPSALVDYSATNGGYVVATKTLTLKPHEFSTSTDDTADAARFLTTYGVRVVELDPADPAAPTTWTDVCASQAGNTVVLTTGLAGWDSSKRYALECDDVASVIAEQLGKGSFLADDESLSTGLADDDAYTYGADDSADAAPVPDIDYSRGYARPYSLADDVGEPVSTHKIANVVNAANHALGTRGCQVLLCDHLATPADNSASKGSETLLYGPVPLPIYGDPARVIKFKLRGRCETTDRAASMKIVLASAPLTGTSATALTYPPDGQTSDTVSLAYGTEHVWSGKVEIAPVVSGARPPVTWCWITGNTTDAAATAILADVFAAEDEL